MIKGITVILYEKKRVDKDDFGNPVYSETPVKVKNVLVAPASTEEVLDSLRLTGKRAIYNIAIPKGDSHQWRDNRIDFFGCSWQVIGFPQEGIERNIPLFWNQKWMVAKYE